MSADAESLHALDDVHIDRRAGGAAEVSCLLPLSLQHGTPDRSLCTRRDRARTGIRPQCRSRPRQESKGDPCRSLVQRSDGRPLDSLWGMLRTEPVRQSVLDSPPRGSMAEVGLGSQCSLYVNFSIM